MWDTIAIRRMAAERTEKTARILENDSVSGDAIETAIKEAENFSYYKSVGYGGLSNEEMEVGLDVVYIDGTTFDIGAVTAIKDFVNPISIAHRLSKENMNNLLVGEGTEKSVHKEDFEHKNMLNDRTRIRYRNRVKGVQELEIKSYSGHGTVSTVCLDSYGDMMAATSASGLFIKKKDRVGDSPISGFGFYVDSRIGGADAMGFGEDLMKGCISYEIVRLMKKGKHPQKACDIAVSQPDQGLTKWRDKAGDILFVAVNSKGEWDVATNIEEFPFAVATQTQKSIVYVIKREHGKCVHEGVSSE